ncbi:GNAT family N-acetyltransferase [Streptomyces sp. XM4193]|uniref:GNAT family N-acetyltransferase n=1 Tax=Streptomyces sp. XM4193 TaxID=2929782 RepID=UPI001FFA7204|nr:GNAT family N-acetyltransferase [Streptomyces sp. XM4193]MCK1796616.1 GNAT family N-acetyltransferase [Streptomyces sp. XM4193]
MVLRYELDPVADQQLATGISRLWADVTNAGGAVGFLPPVTPAETRPEVIMHFAAVSEGRTRQLVGFDADGEVKATAYITFNRRSLMRHWVWLYTVMVHPDLQGRGVGRELMSAVAEEVRGFEGVGAIRLTCRSNQGNERFYEACGYKEVGRVPGAIKVGEGEYRDDVTMWLTLS